MITLRKLFASAAAFIFLCAPLAPPLAAQTNSAPPETISFEDAINYALQHYPAIRASLEQITAAQAGIKLARTQYLPQLSGIYQDSRATQNQVPGIWLSTSITPTVEGPIGANTGQSFWGSQVAAMFSWEPVDFGLRSARMNQARSTNDKAIADLALTQLQVAESVGNYFLIAVANHRVVVAAQANVERWQAFQKSVHALVDNQLRPGADASRADAEVARAMTQLYQAQKSEKVALDTLAALLGAAGSDLQLDSKSLADLPTADSPAPTAASGHPLARDAMAIVQDIRSQERVLGRTDLPRIYLQAEALGRGSEVPNGSSIIGDWDGLAPARGNWIAGVTILFPDVFSLKALSAQKQIASADERSQQARYEQTIQDLTGQIHAARDEWKAAQLVAAQTPVELHAAQQSDAQSRARYQSGLTTITEVAESQNLLAQAELDDAIARLNVWRGLFEIASAQGDLRGFLQILHGAPAGER